MFLKLLREARISSIVVVSFCILKNNRRKYIYLLEELLFKLAVIYIFTLQEGTKIVQRRIARAICSVIPATKGLAISVVVRGNRWEIFDSTRTGGCCSSIALVFEPRILILVTSTPRYASPLLIRSVFSVILTPLKTRPTLFIAAYDAPTATIAKS